MARAIPARWRLADAAIRANLLPAAMGTSVYSTRADPSGRYTLTMPAGDVEIAAQLAAQGALTDGAVLTRATIGAGQTATLDLGLLRPTLGPASRYFPQTGFGVDNPAIWGYFSARGGVATFGFPVSETFRLLGFTVPVLPAPGVAGLPRWLRSPAEPAGSRPFPGSRA